MPKPSPKVQELIDQIKRANDRGDNDAVMRLTQEKEQYQIERKRAQNRERKRTRRNDPDYAERERKRRKELRDNRTFKLPEALLNNHYKWLDSIKPKVEGKPSNAKKVLHGYESSSSTGTEVSRS